MPRVLGEGVVRVRPDLSRFGADLSRRARGTKLAVSPDTSGYGKALDRSVDAPTRRVGSRMGTIFKRAAIIGGVGIALGARAGIRALGSVVQTASSAQQSMGATESVFGRFSDRVIRASNQAANSVGLDASSYRDQANLLGSLFANQGVKASQLAGKTRSLIGVASDLSSVFGGTTKEAVEALGSAYKGEFDPLERYGISIKQSSINAVLAARGQDKLTGAALRQAQQVATTDLIMKQSAKTRGNFARETNTYAGQQERARAQISNLGATIGSALVPALTTGGKVLNTNVLPPLQRLAEKYAPAAGRALGDLATRVGPRVEQFLNGLGSFKMPNLSGGSTGDLSKSLSSIAASISSIDTGALRKAFGEGLSDTVSVFSVVIGFAADHIDTLAAAMPALITGFIVYKAAQATANLAAIAAVPVTIAQVGANITLASSNRALATQMAITNGVENTSILTRARNTVATVASRAASLAMRGVTMAWAAAQWVLNAAMSANPLGLVVIAVVALVAAFVIAYRRSETFRNIVHGALRAIGAVGQWLWNNALRPAFSAWMGYMRLIGSVARWLWNNAIAPAFRGIANGAAFVMRTFAAMLRALSRVPGFGWARTAARAMDAAADKASALANNIRNIPNRTVTVTYEQRTRDLRGAGRAVGGMVAKASGGPVFRGRSYLVGEYGREVITMGANGYVSTTARTNQLARSGAGQLPTGGGASSSSGGGALSTETLLQLLVSGRLELVVDDQRFGAHLRHVAGDVYAGRDAELTAKDRRNAVTGAPAR